MDAEMQSSGVVCRETGSLSPGPEVEAVEKVKVKHSEYCQRLDLESMSRGVDCLNLLPHRGV